MLTDLVSIDDSEALIGPDRRRSRQIVVIVPGIEPHHVGARFTIYRPDNTAVPVINDDGRRPFRRTSVATNQDLVFGSYSHALRCVAVCERDDECRFDCLLHRIDDSNPAFALWMARDARHGDVELTGPAVELALFDPVTRIWAAATVEHKLF